MVPFTVRTLNRSCTVGDAILQFFFLLRERILYVMVGLPTVVGNKYYKLYKRFTHIFNAQVVHINYYNNVKLNKLIFGCFFFLLYLRFNLSIHFYFFSTHVISLINLICYISLITNNCLLLSFGET